MALLVLLYMMQGIPMGLTLGAMCVHVRVCACFLGYSCVCAFVSVRANVHVFACVCVCPWCVFM